MKRIGVLTVLLFIQLGFISVAMAGDFGWLDKLNARAKSDTSKFIVNLAARFDIGEVKVKAVLNDVANLSDAYMVLRLGELSHKSPKEVLDVYHSNRKKGWGVMAKKLGIKPGSREFHALKRGHDLDKSKSQGNGHPSGKGKGKNKEKKGKGKKK